MPIYMRVARRDRSGLVEFVRSEEVPRQKFLRRGFGLAQTS